jgi:hypothetical protein
VALRKPSDLFNKKESSVVFKSSEISSNITETYDRFRDNLDKVNVLSEQIEYLSQQLSEKMTRTDLENAMYSQLMILDENFKSIQNQVRGLNKEDLKEFKVNISNLTEIVGNLVENELPKYKKQVTKNEVNIGNKFDELKEVVQENIVVIREEIDDKVNDIAEIIDTNLEYFNNQLQETSTEVKKTTDTYNKLSKIVENRISKENEKLEEYSQVIQSLHEAFIELEKSLQEETSTYNQIIEEKFANISSDVKSTIHSIDENVNHRIDSIDEDVDTFKNQVSSDILSIKSDVVINEQHLKKVEKFLKENHQELVDLKEEVFGELEKLPYGDIQENVERLNKKIQYIEDVYKNIEPEVIVKEVIAEGLLNEPPSTKNIDPLTPLDKNFVTLDQLQQHYRLFLNRIQQQLATLGGGGETRLKYLDDIVGIATNASSYDGKFLKYNHSLGKFEFDIVNQSNTENIVTNSISITDNDSTNDYTGDVVALQKSYIAVGQTSTPISIHKLLSVYEYSTVEYFIQATKDLNVDSRKMLTVNNKTNINKEEIHSVSIGSTFVNYDVNVEDGYINLVATASTSSKIVYSIVYTAITRPIIKFMLADENNNTILTENDKMLIAEDY